MGAESDECSMPDGIRLQAAILIVARCQRSCSGISNQHGRHHDRYLRGYGALYLQHITQANEGCDFDFLAAGGPTPEPEIH